MSHTLNCLAQEFLNLMAKLVGRDPYEELSASVLQILDMIQQDLFEE